MHAGISGRNSFNGVDIPVYFGSVSIDGAYAIPVEANLGIGGIPLVPRPVRPAAVNYVTSPVEDTAYGMRVL